MVNPRDIAGERKKKKTKKKKQQQQQQQQQTNKQKHDLKSRTHVFLRLCQPSFNGLGRRLCSFKRSRARSTDLSKTFQCNTHGDCSQKVIDNVVVALVWFSKWWRGWGGVGLVTPSRKPAGNIARQALTWNPQRKRKRGRPKSTWCRDTQAEMLRSITPGRILFVGWLLNVPATG